MPASPIAAVVGISSNLVQPLFVDAIQTWSASGVRVAGLIEEINRLADRTCSAGMLRVIGSDDRHSIFLDVPPAGTSCHIDASGAGAASSDILKRLDACDLLVLSKFGKLEAAGGGLRPAFDAAIRSGIPVLTAVSEKHVEAWRSYAPSAKDLAPTAGALVHWWAGRERTSVAHAGIPHSDA